MNIECFKQSETRRTVRCKAKSKSVSIQILNYTEDLYAKWKPVINEVYMSGSEEFIMSDNDLTNMFCDFTNLSITIDELNESLENPSHTFATIFKELQCVMNEMIVRYLQEKQIEMCSLKKAIEETSVLISGSELDHAIKRLTESSTKLGDCIG